MLWDLDQDTDVMVGSKIFVDKEECDLKKKAAQLDQINVVLRGGTAMGQLPPLPSLGIPSATATPGITPGPSGSQNQGKEDAPSLKMRRVEAEFQQPNDVPEYNVGDTVWTCGHKAKTTHALKLHIMRMHKGEYLYNCEICKKGFTQKDGYNTHKLVHDPESENIQCTHKDCNVTFVSKRNLNAHLKSQHGDKRFFVCSHCTKTYSTEEFCQNMLHGVNNTLLCSGTCVCKEDHQLSTSQKE